jgi:hypothetical protein
VITACLALISFAVYSNLVLANRTFETLRRDGVEGKATIARKWSQQVKGGTNYYVSYSFKGYSSGTRPVDASAYDRIKEGNEVPLVYLPSNPAINRLVAEPQPATPALALALMIPGAGVFLVTFIVIVLIRRQWTLVSMGEATGGTVIESRRAAKGGRLITYSFVDQTGLKHIGKSLVSGKATPTVGAIVTVLFAPENPNRNVLYPAPLVRLSGEEQMRWIGRSLSIAGVILVLLAAWMNLRPTGTWGAVAVGISVYNASSVLTTVVGKASEAEAREAVLQACRNNSRAAEDARSACAVVSTFENQCVATVGPRWVIAADEQAARDEAIAKFCSPAEPLLRGPCTQVGGRYPGVTAACQPKSFLRRISSTIG